MYSIISELQRSNSADCCEFVELCVDLEVALRLPLFCTHRHICNARGETLTLFLLFSSSPLSHPRIKRSSERAHRCRYTQVALGSKFLD